MWFKQTTLFLQCTCTCIYRPSTYMSGTVYSSIKRTLLYPGPPPPPAYITRKKPSVFSTHNKHSMGEGAGNHGGINLSQRYNHSSISAKMCVPKHIQCHRKLMQVIGKKLTHIQRGHHKYILSRKSYMKYI